MGKSQKKRERGRWEWETVYKVKIPCSESDLEIFRDHTSILAVDFEDFILRLCAELQLNEAWKKRLATHNFEEVDKLIVSFLEDLKEVFKVPKLSLNKDEDDTPWNVRVARFMEFLLQLLMGKSHSFTFGENLVIKELRTFIPILLDTPFQATEDGEVHILSFQFENLANDAGRLVHSFVFSPHPPFKRMDEVLLEPIILLKANVVKFLKSRSYVTPPTNLNCAMSLVYIVDSFLYDLENILNWDDDLIVEVKDHVEMLHQSLKLSWSLLKEHSDNWTDDAREIVLLAYDAEYLVNYFLSGDAPAWYAAVRLSSIIHNVEVVGARLQKLMKENQDLDQVLIIEDNYEPQPSIQNGINSGVNDTIVGFEDEELQIHHELMGVEELQIIFVFGMPGIGKTTLAKKLSNTPVVRDRFDQFSWCTVSQVYKRKKLLVDILMGLESGIEKATMEEMDDYCVAERIYKSLKGRRYFIVMDDIWELNVWEDIQRYFPDDDNGSRLLFTSRNKEVAPYNSTIHALPLLSTDQCWELLKKVFHGESCPPQLQHIGEEIAANCRGLPLVVVVVAGILSTVKKDLSVWENVGQTLDSYILSYQDNFVRQTLKLCYMHLPQHLKPCFLYFGRFQEDEEICVNTLTQLWIAEGFIPMGVRKRTQKTAEEYLKELIDKSLVIVAKRKSDGQPKVCVVHDLLRDMCLNIIEEDNFLKLINTDYSVCNHKFHRFLCHSSSKYLQPYGQRIRSFFICSVRQHESLSLNVHNLKVVRALDCRINRRHHYCDLVGVQNLVHLRYLAVEQMPTPLGSFSNLEFLIVEDEVCISLIILNMKKLRYLRALKVLLDIDCNNTTKTNNLESLSEVDISNQKDEHWLKHSPHLRNLKCYYSSWADEGIRKSDLSFLTQLESLTVSARITAIKFPLNLVKLHLSYLRWSWENMSVIGTLPNLKVLKLGQMAYVGDRWETRDAEFRQLRYLKLDMVSDLVEWNISSWEHFPKLQQLILHGCHKLKEIPSEIGDIPTLQLIDIYWCRESVAESVIQIQEQLKEEGNEDHVRIVIEHIVSISRPQWWSLLAM